MKSAFNTKREGRRDDTSGTPRDVPYTMKLPDGRRLFVEVPGEWAVADRGGEVGFTPDGVRFLDKVRALAMQLEHPPTPGHIASLREALGLTQQEFAERVGVNKLTVSRWERGMLRPGAKSLRALRRLRRQAVRRGVALAVR